MKRPCSKIELAATQDESRPALTSVYLDTKRETLQAADGWILARIPALLAADGDIAGPISREAFDYAREHDAPVMVMNQKEVVIGIARFDRPDEMSNDMEERLDIVTKIAEDTIENCHIKIGLSISLLHRLAEAICNDSRLDVVLCISDDPTSPIAVRSLADEKCIGLVMPMAIVKAEKEKIND